MRNFGIPGTAGSLEMLFSLVTKCLSVALSVRFDEATSNFESQ
jgi:hypothetical protein